MTLEEAKNLTPEKVNRVIAEAIGWKQCSTVCINGEWRSGKFWYDGNREFDPAYPPIGYSAWFRPPDYFHDLNACADARDSITEAEEIPYWNALLKLAGLPERAADVFTVGDWNRLVHSPPGRRAIALAVVLSERGKE